MKRLEKRLLPVGKRKITILEGGREHERKLLHLNGFCNPSEAYKHLDNLATQHHVAALDLSGMPIGEPHPKSLDEYKDVALAALDELGWGRYWAAGHSIGATTAWLLGTSEHPPEHMTLFQPLLSHRNSPYSLHSAVMFPSIAHIAANTANHLYCVAAERLLHTQKKSSRRADAEAELIWRGLDSWQQLNRTQPPLAQILHRATPFVLHAGTPAHMLLTDFAKFSYTGNNTVPGRIILSEDDILFPPYESDVEEISSASPCAEIVLLKSSCRRSLHHSWPVDYPAFARDILIGEEIHPRYRGSVLPDSTDSHTVPLLLGVAGLGAAFATYCLLHRRAEPHG